ncbi:hypothetical protein MMC29_000603 [Sticta canariensis]|nr:hypothetical protein [Sticta canariensis]
MYPSILFSVLLLFTSSILPALCKPIEPPLPVKVFYQFPVGTWPEDMAVRENGKILTTFLTSPDILEVDTKANSPRLVHTFADKTSCTGIFGSPTTMDKDVFYVIAGNMDLNPSSFGPVRGSWSVYRATLRHHHHPTRKPAHVSLVADFPDSIMLSGITMLHRRKKWFLVGDSSAGIVYRLDGVSGKVAKVLDDPLMKPKKPDSGPLTFSVGINKMTIHDGHLYFTNTDRNIFARVAIHEDSNPKGSAEVLAAPDSPTGFVYDGDDVYFAQNGDNRLARVRGNIVTTIAPDVTDRESEPFGPTALAWGKIHYGRKLVTSINGGTNDGDKLLISTNGGTAQYLTGEYTRGGTISQVQIVH